MTPFSTAQNNEHYKVALALSRSVALTNKSGYVYESAAKAWLNGMGYSKEEEEKIIALAFEIASNNLSGDSSVNASTADIVSKYSDSNVNAKSTAD